MVSTPGLAARALDLIPLNDRQSCESWEYNKHLCKLFVPDGGCIFICCLGLWGSIESLVNGIEDGFLGIDGWVQNAVEGEFHLLNEQITPSFSEILHPEQNLG
jgi:hypothetical protein